ncbi:MAG TPA: tRNA dihydrouridine synthase DusB [Syntrophales bacterium]|nr:tRNA dihydrouridine synthase DusB [Syntrophales bacterium]HON23677.1 tRNA dihydrouridine synthase DusB [Syntrophales bacterium]HOU77973.1 tRNA dihydrouridine synthase DusB [Syntrophales bacterium]HPC32914.1 tRNA dihydrouridine synthase DusB [Syntrophales bacterium]HQG34171.1 tRNA dihydrouridine synthase DusB [Syntrophales bacterium]
MRIGGLVFPLPVFLAPMAGITNLPFRTIVRRYGCLLAFTEMVSVNGLVRNSGRTCRYLDSGPEDRPLGVQIFGGDPETMAEGARIVTDRGADLIDINMGCPVKKVVRSGAGAAILKDPVRAGRIVGEVRRATHLPLTVKIRAGWRRNDINAPLISRIAAAEGADAVIIHPRTADQGFSGTADWSIIAAVKEAVQIPVVGNGDIRRAADVRRMLAITACDGVMIGRAALGKPWIFREIKELWVPGGTVVPVSGKQEKDGEQTTNTGETGGESREIKGEGTQKKGAQVSLSERERVIREHLKLESSYAGPGAGVQNFRKHILWYTKGLPGSATLRQRLGALRDAGSMLAVLQAYFGEINNALDFS